VGSPDSPVAPWWRAANNSRHTVVGLLRQSAYSPAGCEDTNDAERPSVDPTTRQVVGGRAKTRQAASASQMRRFDTDILIQPKNRSAVMDLSGRRRRCDGSKRISGQD